jgi:YbgC/YbaW family acyl-CoA thioester hydrolase
MFVDKKNINFFDCDPAGIIFFSRVFEFCHSAYEKLIQSFNLDENYWDNPSYLVPIIHTECDYFNPLKYGDELSIELQVSKLKSSSFEITYKLFSKGILCATVKTVHIFVSRENWVKMEIPTEIMIGLQYHLAK